MSQQDDLARLFRAGSGKLMAALITQCRDLQLAEDALQDAFVQASEAWPNNQRPDNPEAWLFTTAKRRLIDKLRQSSRQSDIKILAEINDSLSPESREVEADQPIPDERLKLIFTCCHPALNEQARVALTLKTLCGLSAREIARAYLMSETTMNQRLVRAKQKIRKTGIAYKIPEGDALSERLDSVLAVIYLIYNESYSAFEGQTLTREDLAEEAIRLVRVLYALLPEPEVAGLLALMLLHQARNPARSDHEHQFIPLELQDRSKWDRTKISEGRTLLLATLGLGKPDKYQLQASISALHTEAETWEATDWKQILLLYLTLYEKEPSPVVKLNGLVALAQSGNVEEALRQLEPLADELENYQPFYAAKADMESRLGFSDLAVQSYEKAVALSNNEAEKNFLAKQLQAQRNNN